MDGSACVDQEIQHVNQRRLSRLCRVEVDGRSNTLIVTDVKENIDAIRQLVSILDQPEPQVEIETRIVIATHNFSRDLGVQLAGIGFGQKTVNGFRVPNGGGSISTLPIATTTGGS